MARHVGPSRTFSRSCKRFVNKNKSLAPPEWRAHLGSWEGEGEGRKRKARAREIASSPCSRL